MTDATTKAKQIPLPKGWGEAVRAAVLHAISLAQFAAARTRGWAADSINARVRLKAQLDHAREEVALLREEIRIKNARMEQIPASRRPRYPPTERMAILALKAARRWSLEQTARAMQVTAATIASWLNRIDEDGPAALVQLPQPVNRFPEFTRQVVTRLKTLCPAMGKVKIAQTLARAGLHLGATTVGRMLKEGGEEAVTEATTPEPPMPGQPSPPAPLPSGRVRPAGEGSEIAGRVVTAKYPNHVWHVDLTAVPTGLGFWCSWLPFALPQRWPFCWWMAVALDHFSRREMGFTAFKQQPTSEAIRAFLGRTIHTAGKAPKHLVTDSGMQFRNDGFKAWCQQKGIQPRFGAIGQHGSIAVVERFILSLKNGCTRLLLTPYRREAFLRELAVFGQWYNGHRAHTWLGGKTPDEVYHGKYPSNRKPRYEVRACWPRGSPCARPWALVRGKPGARVELQVRFYKGRRHLPIVTLSRAA